MSKYRDALQGLNEAQRQAVETTEGPVLVIAGPGTGKTQLLTTRIAHILATTDTLPENILCLTFTESAAQTMRARLANLIGQAAYRVTISTYHAFGSNLIRRFPDYFADLADLRAVDDLGMDGVFRGILDSLPYSNPLKNATVYLNDIKTFVSDAKRALLSPQDIAFVAEQNLQFIEQGNTIVAQHLQDMARVDKKAIPHFADLLEDLAAISTTDKLVQNVSSLGAECVQSLQQTLAEVDETGKTTSLTAWKNTWLAKDNAGHFVLDGAKAMHKLQAAADVYAKYLAALTERGLFDYDDMILRAVDALSNNNELRYTLQEKYLYLLLDEFQDTNGAQLRLVELLSDNPASEGRPNVLAVGDDDQAIYAFQGANYSHMLQFQQLYRDVLLVPLTKNYRSHANVLHTARGIAEQIEERLHHHFPQIEKTLTAESTRLPKTAVVERREAKSDVAQYAWIAQQIEQLVSQGIPLSEIAVLAPQHKYLEPLVAFLQQRKLPVRYEKRENVLDDPAIAELVRMSELCLALSRGDHDTANSLWAEVLSFSFWQLPTSKIWQLSWQANDDHANWADILLQDETLKPIVLFFIRLSMIASTETLETLLDYLIGVVPLALQEPDHERYKSPMYQHYFDDGAQDTNLGNFWQLLTNLTVLRTRLRDYKAQDDEPLGLQDFITFVGAHRAANIKVLNTSPYQEAADAVQLMTAFKSKGMEFGAVFVVACNDDVWGSKSRGQSARLVLPANLQFMRYAGATNDERLRLFYVAITRAKTHLYLLNYTANFAGKTLARLRYLNETSEEGEVQSPLLPGGHQLVLPAASDSSAPTADLSAYWQQRHICALGKKDLKAMLQTRLEQFQLSPTHVGAFIDVINAGPAAFFMNTILRFPSAPSTNGQFGNAIHETLEWLHKQYKRSNEVPGLEATLKTFEQKLRSKRLSIQTTALLLERGTLALTAYLQQRQHTITTKNEAEYNFRNEGVFIGPAHMGGKIDKLIIDEKTKTITIVDYKTGKGYERWTHEPKLHRYQQQLYLYKLLVEGSRRFKGYTVTGAYLEFVEPNEDGHIQELHLHIDDTAIADLRKLVAVVWKHIQEIDLPNTDAYPQTYAGMLMFEAQLQAEE